MWAVTIFGVVTASLERPGRNNHKVTCKALGNFGATLGSKLGSLAKVRFKSYCTS